jgi:hypothetical protein
MCTDPIERIGGFFRLTSLQLGRDQLDFDDYSAPEPLLMSRMGSLRFFPKQAKISEGAAPRDDPVDKRFLSFSHRRPLLVWLGKPIQT